MTIEVETTALPAPVIPDKQALIQAFVAEWATDIEKIGTMLNHQAESREWCGEYDDIIQTINDTIYFQLADRQEEFTVNFKGLGVAVVAIELDVEMPVHLVNDSGQRNEVVRGQVHRIFDRYSDTPEYISLEVKETELQEIMSTSVADRED